MQHSINSKLLAILGLLWLSPFIIGASASADDTWARMAPMPTIRSGLAVGVVNGTIYAVGGHNAVNGDFYTAVESYDPGTNTWSAKTPMSVVRADFAIGVVNGTLYAVGGHNLYNNINSVEAYDPVTDTWSTRAPMIAGGYSFLAVGVIDDILYAVGGSRNGGGADTVSAYNPAHNAWVSKAPLPTPRQQLAVGVVNGILYAVGGYNGSALATVEAYDPISDTWTSRAPMPTARYSFALGVVDGILYAIGGFSSGVVATVEAYDPATDTWTTKAPMPTARYDFAAGTLSPIIYAVGGNTSNCCYDIIGKLEAYTAPISPANFPPTAIPGANQTVHIGQVVALDGSGSYDDNTPSALLQYAWEFVSMPSGSAATLVNADSTSPSFVVDRLGTYVVQVTVTDAAGLASSAANVTISSANMPPTAHAGDAQAAVVGQTVTLNGAGSFDPDGDTLTYMWGFLDKPLGSLTVLAGAVTPTPSFTPDLPGQYTVGLMVSDGVGGSPQAQVTISIVSAADYAQNRIADALSYVASLAPSQFKAPGHKNSISNLLTQAINDLQAGEYEKATMKVNEALGRVDGYPVRGVVDRSGPGMDWITDTVAQSILYPTLIDALEYSPVECRRHHAAGKHPAHGDGNHRKVRHRQHEEDDDGDTQRRRAGGAE